MKNEVLERSLHFGSKIINFCRLINEQKQFAISTQILKCGTSIGANVSEAQRPHSRADFIAKMIIASKEAQETMFWFELCVRDQHLPDPGELVGDLEVIQKLIARIIISAKSKSHSKHP